MLKAEIWEKILWLCSYAAQYSIRPANTVLHLHYDRQILLFGCFSPIKLWRQSYFHLMPVWISLTKIDAEVVFGVIPLNLRCLHVVHFLRGKSLYSQKVVSCFLPLFYKL